jgi:hypothetical protein
VHGSRTVPPWFLVVIHASVKTNCLCAVYDLIYSSCDREDTKETLLSLGGKTLLIFFSRSFGFVSFEQTNKEKTAIFPAYNYKT